MPAEYKKAAVRGVAAVVMALAAAVLLMLTLKSDDYYSAVETDPAGWHYFETIEFDYHNRDTVSLRNIYVFILADENYAERHEPVSLEITTTSPDSLFHTETWTLIPVLPDEPYRNRTKKYCEYEQLYRGDVRLSKEGTYHFAIAHGEPVPKRGIWAVGMKITE